MTTSKPMSTRTNNLVEGLNVVRSLVNTANTNPDLLMSGPRTLKSLSKAINRLDKVLNDKSNRAMLPIRKQTKILHNTLVSLSHGISQDNIEVDAFIEELQNSCADSLLAIDSLSTTLEDSSDYGIDLDGTLLGDMSSESADEVELSDLPAYVKGPVDANNYTKTIQRLNKYEKSKAKLARTLRPNAVVPTELPLTIMFESGKLRSNDLLDSLFPGQVDLLGLNGSRSQDIGLVLRDQIVMQFSKTAALEQAEEDVLESGTASELKKTAAVVKNLKNKLKEVVSRRNDVLYEIDNMAFKRGKSTLETARLKKIFKAQIAELDVEADALQTKAADLRLKLQHHEDRVRTAKSVHTASKKVKLTSGNVFFAHINSFLESLREHGRDYTLMTSVFLQSPVNKDIMMCWVVPTSTYRKMAGLAGNTKVLSWGPAWSSAKTQRTKSMPASMKLSTRIGR